MSPLFDLRALSILSLFTSLLLALALILSRRVRRDSPSIGSWIAGAVQLAAGFLLIGLRNLLPDAISIIVANVLIATGFCWVHFALRLTLGQPLGRRWDIVCGLLVAVSFAYFSQVAPNLAARIAIISAVIAAVAFASARLLLLSAAAGRDPDRPVLVVIGATLLFAALVYLARVGLVFLDPPAGEFLVLTGGIHRAAFLSLIALNLTLILGLSYLFAMRAQRQLSSNEALQAATFEQAAVGIGLFDLDGRWLKANRGLCELLGYGEAELLSMRFHDNTHPDDLASSEADRADLLAGRRGSITREKRYLRKDGSPVWTRRSTSLIRKADGTPDHFISVIESIQARKDAERELHAAQAAVVEEAERSRRAALNLMEDALVSRQASEATAARLKESEERLHLLVDHVPLALALFDREMRYLAVSRSWGEFFGTGGQDLIGRSHYEVFPDLREEWKDAHRRGLAGEVVGSADPYVLDDGRAIWTRWEVRPWHAADGAIGGIVIFAEDISDRTRAESDLRESEHRFHDIVDASADWIWEVDAEGRYIYASENVMQLLGYTAAEMIGKTPFDFMPQGEAERVRAEFAAVVASKAPFRDLDNLNLHKDGSLRHVATNGMPILAADGTLLGYRGLDRDITEKKAGEKALRDAHERLRTLIDTLPDLVWLKDIEGVYLFCNRRFEAFFGAREKDIVGKTDFDFVPRELADFFRAHDLVALAADRPSVNEEEVTFASDGHREMLQTVKTPLRDSEGRVIGVLGVARDITAIRASEAALRARERYIRALFDNFPFMVWLKDRDSRFLAVNREFAKVAGACDAEAVLGKADRDFWPAEMADQFVADDREVLASGQPKTVEEEIIEPGRRFWMETFKSPVELDGEVIGTVGFARDISGKKQADAELRELADDMAATLQAIPDLLFEIDAEGRYLAVKASQTALLAVPADRLLGRTVGEVLPPEAAGTVMAALAAASTNGVDYGRTIMLPLVDGLRYFEISVAGKPGDGGEIGRFVVLSRDITSREMAKEELKARNEELERFNRASVDRELDMIEMKKAINALERELGREAPYSLDFLENDGGSITP